MRLGLDSSARAVHLHRGRDGQGKYRRIVWDGAYGRDQAADG